MKKFIVITTIHDKSDAIRAFEKFEDWHIILVGDVKSVPIKNTKKLTFLSIEEQLESGFSLAKLAPKNHYARKNIGYLYAIKNGADLIYDTDDDNIPYPDWTFPDLECDIVCNSNEKFINSYKFFTNEFIWPRGYPLDEISKPESGILKSTTPMEVGVWQGLADLEPDVDAIFRLVFNKPIKFNSNTPFCLQKDSYCPINSQNTLWRKELFYLLYLPATVSFRFTDILRGYIAQRLLWQHDYYAGFTGANVYQERNPHNLMNDFKDEIIFYERTREIVDLIDNLNLTGISPVNLSLTFELLFKKGLVAADELEICEAWLKDLSLLKSNSLS